MNVYTHLVLVAYIPGIEIYGIGLQTFPKTMPTAVTFWLSFGQHLTIDTVRIVTIRIFRDHVSFSSPSAFVWIG